MPSFSEAYGANGRPERITRQVEHEDRRADQHLLAARVLDPNVSRAGSGTTSSTRSTGQHVGRSMRGAGLAAAAHPRPVVPGDHLGVEAKPGHEGEPPAVGFPQVDRDSAAVVDHLGQARPARCGSRSGGQTGFRCRQADRDRHLGSIINQGRDRAIATRRHDRHDTQDRTSFEPARCARWASRPPGERCPGLAGRLDQVVDPAPSPADPGGRIGGDSDPRRSCPYQVSLLVGPKRSVTARSGMEEHSTQRINEAGRVRASARLGALELLHHLLVLLVRGDKAGLQTGELLNQEFRPTS